MYYTQTMLGQPIINRIRPLEALPDNFATFVDEIAGGVGGLYGPEATLNYRAKARRSFSASIAHADMELLAMRRGNKALGMLLLQYRDGFGEIPFMHVLKEHEKTDCADRLVAEATRRLRKRHVNGIISEFVPFFRGDIAACFAAQGYDVLSRELMRADVPTVAAPNAMRNAPTSRPLRVGEFPEAADCIVSAYQDHPGRRLHLEVQNVAGARDFLQRLAAGSYGATRSDYLRSVWKHDACVGAALGCEVSPGCGFLLQLVVRQEARGSEIGSALVRDLAAIYHKREMRQMFLGVTCDNPAKKLYERLGFTTLLRVNAYVWWKP